MDEDENKIYFIVDATLAKDNAVGEKKEPRIRIQRSETRDLVARRDATGRQSYIDPEIRLFLEPLQFPLNANT